MIWILMIFCFIVTVINLNLRDYVEEKEELRSWNRAEHIRQVNNRYNIYVTTFIITSILLISVLVLVIVDFTAFRLALFFLLLTIFCFDKTENGDEMSVLNYILILITIVLMMWAAFEFLSRPYDDSNKDEISTCWEEASSEVERYELLSLGNIIETETKLEADLNGSFLFGIGRKSIFYDNTRNSGNVHGNIEGSVEDIEYYRFFYLNSENRAVYRKFDINSGIKPRFIDDDEIPYYEVTTTTYELVSTNEETGEKWVTDYDYKYERRLGIYESMFNSYIGIDFKN